MKILNGKNLPLRDKSPWVTFTKLAIGEGVSGPPPRAKFHYSGFGHVGLSPPKLLKYVFFCYKSAPNGPIPLWIFKTKFSFEEGLPGSHPQAISPLWLLKCGLTATKDIGNFWYKFSPKGYIPLSNSYKIWRGGRSPRSPQSHQLLPLPH